MLAKSVKQVVLPILIAKFSSINDLSMIAKSVKLARIAVLPKSTNDLSFLL